MSSYIKIGEFILSGIAAVFTVAGFVSNHNADKRIEEELKKMSDEEREKVREEAFKAYISNNSEKFEKMLQRTKKTK